MIVLMGGLIGFSIAMPVGPIGLLCMRNSLTLGVRCGLMTGLGAACADALYGLIGGWGARVVSDFLVGQESILKIAGAIVLCYLGASFFFKEPKNSLEKASSAGVFVGTFFLTLANPATIASFAGIYAALGNEVLWTTVGIFLGSMAWWVLLSGLSAYFREKIEVRLVQKIAGLLVFALGLLTLL